MKKSKVIIKALTQKIAADKAKHVKEINDIKSNNAVDADIAEKHIRLLENLIFIYGVGNKLQLLDHISSEIKNYEDDPSDDSKYETLELMLELIDKKSSSYTSIKSGNKSSDKEMRGLAVKKLEDVLY